jgi:hypothetical protein
MLGDIPLIYQWDISGIPLGWDGIPIRYLWATNEIPVGYQWDGMD